MYALLFTHQSECLGLAKAVEGQNWIFKLTQEGTESIGNIVSNWKVRGEEALRNLAKERNLQTLFFQDQAYPYVSKILQSPLQATEQLALLELVSRTPSELINEWATVLA